LPTSRPFTRWKVRALLSNKFGKKKCLQAYMKCGSKLLEQLKKRI
jgi:hypothetical protein